MSDMLVRGYLWRRADFLEFNKSAENDRESA